ncbi:hypothetical protein [Porphyromonas gingivalis]|uniref:hypothetical protein n=1 Tax=Porphyromonas gingivalis TaxID=837 RepID=UPI00211B460D|nr:hypothetical protein [Porphyromonas gingivalis]
MEKPEKRHNLPLTCIGLLLFPPIRTYFLLIRPRPLRVFTFQKIVSNGTKKRGARIFHFPRRKKKVLKPKRKIYGSIFPENTNGNSSVLRSKKSFALSRQINFDVY